MGREHRKPFTDEIKDYSAKLSSFSDLVKRMGEGGGFQAREVSKALDVLVRMEKDPDCMKFLSFTANLVATGLRGVIAEAVRDGLVDVVITTGGTADHDIARSLGGKYYLGNFLEDDVRLHNEELHRLGNVIVPLISYGPIVEGFVRKLVDELGNGKSFSPSEMLAEAGKRLNDGNSILHAAFLKGVPVISPGIVDSAFGTALMYEYQKGKLRLDVLKDMKLMSDEIFEKKRTGAIILGGGISKHHTLWWNQFRDGLDYVLAITTGMEFDGSLTGARISEAISWGKVKTTALISNVLGDATIIFPLLLAAYYEGKSSNK